MEASGVALQSAQLREAREAFLAAVGKIKTELEAIGETFAGLAWTARELAGAAPGVTAHFDRDLERHAAGIEQAVAEWVASRRALGEAAGEVDRACASMSGFVAEIESVGQRMLRLALNAQIQAVHLAASGVVMEALAEGIREVSQKASASAAAAGESLREVETAADGSRRWWAPPAKKAAGSVRWPREPAVWRRRSARAAAKAAGCCGRWPIAARRWRVRFRRCAGASSRIGCWTKLRPSA